MNINDGYIQLIINPKYGSSSNKTLAKGFCEYIREHKFNVKVEFTKSLEHARELAEAAAVDYSCCMVAASGGDGTIREVVHGLEGSDKPLLIIPGGTENLLANELGFDEKLETIIRAFESENICDLDTGKANERYFTCLVGFGFDGEIVRKVAAERKGHIRHLDYFWPIWRTFWEYDFPEFEVEVDGEKIFSGPGLVFVGNISRYAIGLQVLYKAKFGDGLLDVCIYRCHSRMALLKHSAMTILKQQKRSHNVIYRQGTKIRVTSLADTVTEIDGDPGPGLPVDIEVVPRAVKVIVPPNAKPAGIRTRLIRMIG